mmetsp:Transcript_21404/g.52439  ORF Transcript_21404/g.52439 Transcript_21404/m.52439 type:complete len:91 (-) Transcript_21404:288-560(-)
MSSKSNSPTTSLSTLQTLQPLPPFKPNMELVANLQMRARLGEFKASEKEIIEALKLANNVMRRAIGYLKTGRIPGIEEGDSVTGLASKRQ